MRWFVSRVPPCALRSKTNRASNDIVPRRTRLALLARKRFKAADPMQENGVTGTDILAIVLVALGVGSSGTEFIGGLLLAIGGGIGASRLLAIGVVNGAVPLGFLGTVLSAVFVAILADLLSEKLLPTWPVQLPMAVGGFLSSFILPFLLRAASGLASRGEKLAARFLARWLTNDRRK